VLKDALLTLEPFLPTLVAMVLIGVALAVVNRVLLRGVERSGEHHFRHELTMLVLSSIGLLLVVLVLPVSDGTRSQLLNLAGIVLSAGIALASTTFIGNAMAALMLRAVRNFRTGDFIRVGDHFGRVTERGLFHTEIQTEDRDLTTLPNLFLVTNPVKVVRASGTIVSAEISLGYDVDHPRVEKLLLAATEAAGLQDGFVHVVNLGDFSISYRFAGFLADVRQILSTRSRLRTCAIDALHGDGVEIVSPTFMNTRAFATDTQFLTQGTGRLAPSPSEPLAEALAFDKADQAMALEGLVRIQGAVREKLKELESRVAKASPEEKPRLSEAREMLQRRCDNLAETIEGWQADD
jgi:small conductance mechanosensitive channel